METTRAPALMKGPTDMLAWRCLAMKSYTILDKHPGSHPAGGRTVPQRRLPTGPLKEYIKGETRPGDWACSSCGMNNFARRTEFFKCGTPKALR